jgi:hypothetical protein
VVKTRFQGPLDFSPNLLPGHIVLHICYIQEISTWDPGSDAQKTGRNFRVLGSTLRMKAAEVGKILFIEKRKASWGHAGGPGNWWSCGSTWGLCFYSLFYCLRTEMCLRCKQKFSRKERCLLGQLPPFRTSCSPSFNSPLSVITLTPLRDRDKSIQWLLPADRGRWRGPQHQGWPWEESFSCSSGASVVWWILGKRKQTWQVSLKCKAQTQARDNGNYRPQNR